MLHRTPPIPSLLALASLLACAAQSPDKPTAPRADEACHEVSEAACLEDDNAVCCTTVAIKYEYEMLDAKSRGDLEAFARNRKMLASLLDHACALGSDASCDQIERLEANE